MQALRAGISKIDAVLYTHTHADHVHGIDDLRSFNFVNKCSIPLYGLAEHINELRRKFAYCFTANSAYEGGAPPRLELKEIESGKPIYLDSMEILPISLKHGSAEILGYRFNSFAYLTDCSSIPDESKESLQDLEVLIIDALRERPHKTHFSIDQAIEQIETLRPRRAYLTHMSHEVDYEETNRKLAQASDIPIALAYDSLIIDL
jgi:phosphoribosyl 1,2-cyclic phosphate phosphodiesterase